MTFEFKALLRNNTKELVPCFEKMNPLGKKWVFKAKLNSDGPLQIYKVSLVAKGFQQTLRLDYFDSYSLVV